MAENNGNSFMSIEELERYLERYKKPFKMIPIIVDDDVEFTNDISQAFEADPFTDFLTINSGEEAMRLIDSTTEMVIVDDIIPGKYSGLEILQHTKKVSRNSVRIVASGNHSWRRMKEYINNVQPFYWVDKDDPHCIRELLEVIKREAEPLKKRYAYSRYIMEEREEFARLKKQLNLGK